ncbi:hypothetical protein RM531_10800 [Salinisphaera sp. P385]|uniref:GlsB/YeaQ/YmgE family stress response membrane protein n=1 Tax=Spectribacter acetivorans TaxID=3075603 RepID=A0ABU3B912_9GAMM|nr:hypothetical protein [Salinisphaera sp. P385]MDT0618964.1 hypothetical protein [Salinisphaera sp. P385]
MSIIVWMAMGLVAGFVSSLIAGGHGPLLNSALGVIGAITGVTGAGAGAGALALNAADGRGVPGLGLYSVGAAVIGALLVVSIYHRLIRG